MSPDVPSEPLALRIVLGSVVLLALVYTVTYLTCAAVRVSFPWDLEWMEGGMIAHAARVLLGKPIYARPSVDFVAFFYTPLYAYTLAALSYLTGGLSFALGRGVSIAASLATMGMLFYTGRREGGLRAGLLAVGLYAAMFRISGAFYDLARADSLALSISLAAGLVAYYDASKRGAMLSACLFVLAFFAKQTAAVPAPFVGLYLLTVDRKRALWFGGVGIVLGASCFALLDRHYEGWLRFYTVTGHQGHAFYKQNFFADYWRDVLCLAPVLLLVPALGASYGRYTRWLVLPFLALFVYALAQRGFGHDDSVHMYLSELWYARHPDLMPMVPILMAALLVTVRLLQREAEAPPLLFLLLYVAGTLSSDLNHSTQWAYSNCFMPIAVFGSLYAALTFGALTRLSLQHAQLARGASYVLAAALFLQLGALYYRPRRQMPTDRDWTAVKNVLEQLDAQPGPVLMGAHPMYSFLRDGTLHLHQMGFGDVEFAGGLNDFDARLKSGHYRTIVEDEPFDAVVLERDYERIYTFQYPGGALRSKTGFAVRPLAIWSYRGNTPGTH